MFSPERQLSNYTPHSYSNLSSPSFPPQSSRASSNQSNRDEQNKSRSRLKYSPTLRNGTEGEKHVDSNRSNMIMALL